MVQELTPIGGGCAFFWVAEGQRFIEEARISALSAKKQMPDIPCYLFANSLEIPKVFDNWDNKSMRMPPRKNKFLFQDSVNYIILGLEHLESVGIRHAVYFDTDIHMCAPVYEIFDVTRHCDIAGAFAPARRTTTHRNKALPTSIFPEINGGVMPMFVPTMIGFFRSVYDNHVKYEKEYGGNDQGVIRDMMLVNLAGNEHFRYHILPPEYNFRFNMPMTLCGSVKILHGRSDDINKIIADVNARDGMRIWQPYKLLSE